MTSERRTFGPVVLLGLACGAALAVGGTRPWVTATNNALVSPALAGDAGEVPLAGALGLVVLAAWGVLLVTRGRVRLALAALAALAALGSCVTVLRGQAEAGATLARELGVASVPTAPTGWFWLTAVAAPLALVAAVIAVRHVRSWPAMGSRYDAPQTPAGPRTSTAQGAADPQLDLWRALDRGHDPTV